MESYKRIDIYKCISELFTWRVVFKTGPFPSSVFVQRPPGPPCKEGARCASGWPGSKRNGKASLGGLSGGREKLARCSVTHITHMYVQIHTCMCICICTCTCICICTCTGTCACVSMHVCVYVYVYACVYVHVYVCVHVYAHVRRCIRKRMYM